ncbi:DUF58 domain-containing protein [Oleiharenicola lentus]|uniref:DUF58 domain-containing protein n=1 Tax=Oleiharenicola lentus TaxID=2508720 RepID=UPI003F681291
MIPVPAQRLLWSVGAIVPVAAAAGALPELWPLCVIILGVVGIVAALDLLLTLREGRLPVVEAPVVSRLTKDREAKLTLVIVNKSGGPQRARFALALPESFESAEKEIVVSLPADRPRVLVEWKCTPKPRGNFTAGPACFELDSAWGFWQLRAQQLLKAELRVFPNLFSERRQLAALFLERGQAGVRLRRMVGRGREFERLREYQPGDSYDEVHWKGTAKRGRPITKVFQVERTQEIYVIVDASRLSARPVQHDGKTVTTLERYLTAALVLLMAASRQGDRFGLVVHDAQVRAFLRAGNGATHYGACREAVHAMEPSETTPDFAELFSTLRTRLRRRSLLVFLTDLTDPVLAEEFARHVRVISRQHLVLVNQVRAPGVEPLFDREVAGDAEIYDRLAGHLAWREAGDVAGKLQPEGVKAAMLENERLAADLVSQYLQVKRRQLL